MGRPETLGAPAGFHEGAVDLPGTLNATGLVPELLGTLLTLGSPLLSLLTLGHSLGPFPRLGVGDGD